MTRVLVTRAAEDCPPLEALLQARGFETVRFPCVAFEDGRDAARLDERLARAHFVVVASPQAALRLRGRRLPRVAAVGAHTAALLGRDDVLAPEAAGGAEALLPLLAPLVRGKRVLLPRAEEGSPLLAEQLARAGAEVETLALYRTVVPAVADAEGAAALREGRVDVVAFASGSAVRGYTQLACAPARLPAACIGPACAEEARAAGLDVAASGNGTLDSLADAVATAAADRMAATPHVG